MKKMFVLATAVVMAGGVSLAHAANIDKGKALFESPSLGGGTTGKSCKTCHRDGNKINTLYPNIGKCGIDITVTQDKKRKIWVVDLKKGSHELKHHLELSDADACMEGKQCVSLGLEIAQLQKNIEGQQY